MLWIVFTLNLQSDLYEPKQGYKMKSLLTKQMQIDSQVLESAFLQNNYTHFSEFILYCMRYIDKKYNNRYTRIYRRVGSYFMTCILEGKNCKVEYLGIQYENGEYDLIDIKSMHDEHWEIFNSICEQNNRSINNRFEWFDDMNLDANLEELKF